MQAFTLSQPNLFMVASRFVSETKDVRTYLQGVRLEPYGGGAYLVATCGHMLFAGYDPACTVEVPCTVTVEPKPELPAAWGKQNCELEIDPAAGMMICGRLMSKCTVDPDGFYPAWRMLVRDIGNRPIEPVRGFNPDYISHIASAAYALGQKGVIGCRQTGEFEPMLFNLAHNAIAICMPAQRNVPIVEVPDWLTSEHCPPIAAE